MRPTEVFKIPTILRNRFSFWLYVNANEALINKNVNAMPYFIADTTQKTQFVFIQNSVLFFLLILFLFISYDI